MTFGQSQKLHPTKTSVSIRLMNVNSVRKNGKAKRWKKKRSAINARRQTESVFNLLIRNVSWFSILVRFSTFVNERAADVNHSHFECIRPSTIFHVPNWLCAVERANYENCANELNEKESDRKRKKKIENEKVRKERERERTVEKRRRFVQWTTFTCSFGSCCAVSMQHILFLLFFFSPLKMLLHDSVTLETTNFTLENIRNNIAARSRSPKPVCTHSI